MSVKGMSIDWQKVGGMVPVVVQESNTNEVLMFAFMDKEALELSLQTGYAHYFSRTKNRIWKKGEESGNTQKINEIFLDCDNDTLLIKITQNGGIACHTGEKSCFFRQVDLNLKSDKKDENLNSITNKNRQIYNIIDEIYHVILDRKLNADPQSSYVASMFKKGENAILKKIGEEATEFVMACKDASHFEDKIQIPISTNLDELFDSSSNAVDMDEKSKNDVIYEAADLCFHVLIALASHNIHPERIKSELAKRMGISGIEEKNSRNDR
ncbi:bifunctional phosphoribosyl-AMP cyclohydrolase/phosphoribosyl-ATP diphosphatase HisIE [Campylobacter anatolicus]|nr:bifunctional phosphoribosyl-AMP cyclohydrolase/phosphoribosyl-ATP diphosphatase HisIE [Campylobacter anatolicus]